MSRMEKVNNQLRREIAAIILRDVNDPRVEFVTITHVDVSKDLRNAKVFYSVLGDESNAEKAGEALTKAQGYIRRIVGERLDMRYTPELLFIYDKSLNYTIKIDEALKEIEDDRQENY